MLCSSMWWKKKEKQKAINFQKNGSLMVEELIACSRGIYNPIRTFSSHQILQSKYHIDRNCVYYGNFCWYKGTIENRAVLIKKCDVLNFDIENFYRDIAVSSMMSSHKNVLKLLGCCLEFPIPALVFGYPENGVLTYEKHSQGINPLSWNVRLKILKPLNIFLDENWTAKLSSFSLSIPIPEGEKGVQDIICGTVQYIEPQYLTTGFVTEKVDVYSLGILMLSLLTGNYGHNIDRDNGDCIETLPDYVGRFLERGLFTKLIDPSMLNSADDDIPEHSRLQMEAFVELAFRCVGFKPGEDMPNMIDVAKELKHIEKQT